ncbi:MAG TPA: metallophosphoesterase family protein, partial [Bacilli bacterium]|nr:metallophosphoesterase family protein [Bacilli bacterium]
MKKLISVLLIIALLFLFIPQQVVSGASADAYLIATNPGEDTTKEMNVIWHTTITGTFVEYTTKDDTGFASATQVAGQCQAITYRDQGISADITDYKCEATLTNLASDTEYIYHIGKTNFSAFYSFMTSGTSAFTFLYFSDVHAYTPIPSRVDAAQRLVTAIESKYRNLKLVVTGGDMTAYGTYRDQWTSYYGLSMFSKYVVASTPGNHEYYHIADDKAVMGVDGEKYFNMYTNNPKNGAVGVKNTTYYFTYGNVLFISLNSEAYRIANQPAAYAENQRVWLEEVLANNPSQYTVIFHHAPHYGGAAVTSSMWDLQPIMDKYGVDLVLNGHDHVYTRSNRIYNGDNCSDSKKGAIYITGSAIGDRWALEEVLSTDKYVAKKIANDVSLAMGITVSNDYMMVKTYNETGVIVDQV